MPRPRSEKARQAVLEAMRTLLARDGFDAVTIEGIATEAGVSKQTIYRWWPSKAEILGEALLDGEIPGYTLDVPTTTDLASDLREWLRRATTHLGDDDATQIARALIAVTATNPEVGEPLNRRFAGPIVSGIAARIDTAKATDAVRADVDSTAIAGLLLAMTSYAALQGHPISDTHADAIIETLLVGATPR